MSADDDVARLVREHRIVDAASLASARGDARSASDLFERACEWQRAAEEALRAADPSRAMRLAILAGDEALTERALAGLVNDVSGAERLVFTLETHGHHAWTARVLEQLGRGADAARAWERAGNSVRAAELLEMLRDVVGAARVLEAATRLRPLHWPNYVALGSLLLRYGKTQAAARALQAIPSEANERPDALVLLVQALEQLGLAQAATEARRELDARGVTAKTPPADAPREGPEPSTRIYGRYEVVREVASTASSRVLECIDAVRAGRVAIKIYAGANARGAGRDILARFERELRVLGSLDHPNVLSLLDYFPDGPAIVLPWMPGGTLESMMASGRIAPARAVEISSAILGALGEAHRVGVLHRDLKPSNVLFDAAGTARLADFGAAHLGDLSATATAGMIGTIAYMSPEQRNGEPATIASDIYGVGALLLEMLTSERVPHDGSPPAKPSDIHRDLDHRHDALIHSFIAGDPTQRPRDAFASRHALTALPWPSTRSTRDVTKECDTPPRGVPARVVPPRMAGDVDTWLGRRVVRVPLDPATLARASAFARAGHPMLQTVLRVDRKAGEIWLEAASGTSLDALDRPLTESEHARLDDALAALRQTSDVHVTPSHIRVGPMGDLTVCLAFP